MKLDRTELRNRGVDANDGIIATAGIVEGFVGAGARGSTIIVAAFAAMVSGGIALAGAKYSEEAAERDAERALVEEERHQLTMLPHEELTELAEHYRRRGLSPDLAARVAEELSAHDALAAHVVAEHGIDLAVPRVRPVVVAAGSGVAFAIGAAVPLLAVLFAPDDLRALMTFLSVALSLCVTSYIVARAGGTAIGRTIARTVGLGILTMTITLIGGSFFTP
jgi:VIT1/CCC1 family predicted Fe2+/Mn2+ transporter